MAKSPRRRRSSGRPARQPERPPAAKPVKPGIAKPVRPPAAKPVRPPTAKPIAKPVAKPIAKPVAKPIAKPVAKPMAKAPGRPAAAPAKKPSTSSSRPSRMSEQEVAGRGARGGRGGYQGGGGGMAIGAKVGFIAGGVALVVGIAAVLLSTRDAGEAGADDVLQEAGFRAAGQIAAMDPRIWAGEDTGGKGGWKRYKRTFRKLFGAEGEDYWDRLEQDVTDTKQLAQMDADEKDDWQKRHNAFMGLKKQIDSGTLDKQAGVSTGMLLQHVLAVRRYDQETPDPRVLAAWVTKGSLAWQPTWIAQNTGMQKSQLQVDPASFSKAGRGAWGDGTLNIGGSTYEVRVFGVSTGNQRPLSTGWVAVYHAGANEGAGGGSSSALGLALAVLGAVVVGVVASSIASGHTKNIRQLATEIDRLGRSGDPDRQLRTQGIEANAIARAVERMVSHLEFRGKHGGNDMDEVVEREQEIAQEIHRALIARNPPRLGSYEVETLFKPGFEIGGDHFEYFDIDADHLGVILLDTNVRGVPAALVISQAKAYVRAWAPGNLSPADVLRRVNQSLAGELPAGRHVTALYAVIDTKAGKVTLASAGHLPLIVYRHSSGKVFMVNPEGIAMGLDKGPVFDSSLEEGDVPIGVGDRIVLYTDGALQIQNEAGEEFGEQRFYQSVSSEAPKNSQAFVNFVGGAIDRFHLNSPQNDDITISTVKRLK